MPTAPPPADPRRPRGIRIGRHLRGLIDRVLERYSLIPNDPVLDVRTFPWTGALREHWHTIRDEARALALAGSAADRGALAEPRRAFCLWGYGYAVEENIARCPMTSRLVREIPGLSCAFFSVLPPGTHVPLHRGVTKGLVTCHLGLVVPRDGDVRMRLGDRVLRWAEGETLVFDDTCPHELWNDSSGTRIVLLIQFRRPLRQPGRWIAEKLLDSVRRSRFVQDARRNLTGRTEASRRLGA